MSREELEKLLETIPEEGFDCKNRYYKKIPLGRAQDITGIEYTYLVPLFKVNYNNSILTHWLCKCKCGNLVIAKTKDLNSKFTKSCGCYHIEETK